MEKSSFFNSVNGDRKYKASDFAEFFNSLVTNGIFPNPNTNLQVVTNSNNMTVTVKPGKAWINGYVYINTDNLILNVDVADGVLNRIDRVVIKLDFLNREIKTSIKKGTFASNPVAPELQRDADAYELGVADIYIGKGAISITQSNITDLRMNTNLCGWVNSLIQADTTAIFNQYMDWYNSKKNDYEGWYSSTTNQYQTDISNMKLQFQNNFNTWFDTVKNTLGSDVAGNLLNQINSIAGEGRTTETVKGNADAIKRLDEKVVSHLADYTLQVPYAGVTTGSANVYTISTLIITELKAGMAVSLKFHADSTATSTLNWCGLGAKGIKKSNGNDVTNLKSTGIYTLRYDGTNFILQGEGASGNATASDLYSGKTASTDAGDIIGTNPYKVGVSIALNKLTPVNPTLAMLYIYMYASYGGGRDVVYDPINQEVYVPIANTNGGILALNPSNGNVVKLWSTMTQFSDVAVDKYGYPYAIASSGNYLFKFNPNTSNSTVWSIGTLQNGPLFVNVQPSSGYIYVSENNGVIEKVSSSGTSLRVIINYGSSCALGKIVFDTNSNLYIQSNSYYSKILKYNSSDSLVASFDTSFEGNCIAVDSNGYVYGTDNACHLYKYTNTGTLVWTINTTYTVYERTPYIDSNGNVFILIAGKILNMYNSSGTLITSVTLPGGAGGANGNICADGQGNLYINYCAEIGSSNGYCYLSKISQIGTSYIINS